jgi:hypothetical protein
MLRFEAGGIRFRSQGVRFRDVERVAGLHGRWPMERLTPYAKNVRTHSDAQIEQLRSVFNALVCGSGSMSENKEIAARNRRSATRIWCRPSGSSSSIKG